MVLGDPVHPGDRAGLNGTSEMIVADEKYQQQSEAGQ
jgi:hypothetical protein